MSNQGVSGSPSLLPSITGNPSWDRLIRSGLLVAAGSITAIIVTWLNAHGFKDPNIDLMVSGAVFSGLSTAAVVVWGYVNSKNTETAAKNALAIGVAAGISHAEDTSVATVLPSSVSPKVAEAIVETYAPALPKATATST